jgi:hypothetical protein
MHHVGMGDFHTVTLSVDMVNRTAALYTTTRDDMDPTEELKPCKVWNNLQLANNNNLSLPIAAITSWIHFHGATVRSWIANFTNQFINIVV